MVGMPPFYIEVPGLSCHSDSNPTSCLCAPGKQKVVTQILSPCHPCGKPKWSSGLLASACSNSGCYRHLESESAHGGSCEQVVSLPATSLSFVSCWLSKKNRILKSAPLVLKGWLCVINTLILFL